MCGIHLRLRTQRDHEFMLNVYQQYLNNPYFTIYHPNERDELLKQHLKVDEYFRERGLIVNYDNLEAQQSIKARGPDCQHFEQLSFNDCQIELNHSLLHLRGTKDHMIKQPYLDEVTGNYLIFNGEIYSFNGVILDPCQSDTIFLSETLGQFSNKKSNTYNSDILEIIRNLDGDFSFIYIDRLNERMVIAKDFFGKRSLLLSFQEDGFSFSSQPLTKQKCDLVQDDGDHEDCEIEKIDEAYVRKKYMNEYLQILDKNYLEIPGNHMIIIDLRSGQKINWVSQNIHELNIEQCSLEQFNDPNLDVTIKQVTETLKKSVKKLIQNIFQFQDIFTTQTLALQTNITQESTESSLAVFFSGGLDCTFITLLAGQMIGHNSIDLLNVSFQNDSPDRITAIQSYHELKALLPQVKFNLILIDKTIEDVIAYESEFLNIVYPKTTHMDFNIAIVLKFASLGEGYLYHNKQPIKSKAKVILSGLGADELFSGYSRFRVAYLRGGVKEQFEEMKFDILRLWIRNLGRDDRSVSSSGKELRFPFLDLELLHQVWERIPLSVLSDYSKPKGTGDKEILENAQGDQAQSSKHFDYRQCAEFKKRAIQFGTRIAKQSNKRHFGGNKRAKGSASYKLKQG